MELNMARNKYVEIGAVSVDSGQLMLIDPCYIDSLWKDEPFRDIRIYKNADGTRTLQYGKDFQNYQQPIESEGGLTMNQLNADHGWSKVEPTEVSARLSYDGACQQTLTKNYGQLEGHTALAFSTGYGDGIYPVTAKINPEGRIMGIFINFELG